MSSKSKNSALQSNKTTKLRKSSTVTSIQNEKRLSTSNLFDKDEPKMSDILRNCSNSLNIKIIMQNDLCSSDGQRYKTGEDDSEVPYITEEYNKPVLYCYTRNESEGPLRLIFKNGCDTYVQPVLNLPTHFKNLLILQLTYCQLQATQLPLLLSVLNNNPNIKSLSLEGNPLATQTYSDLFQTQLTHLSLRSCKLTASGIANIIQQLRDSALISLNLSSNYLDDNCLERLSSALRLNRKLTSLNLADNWFTDSGLIVFVKVFAKFTLVLEEVINRRRVHMVYLREHQELLKELLKSGFQPKQSTVSAKSLRSPGRLNNRPSSAPNDARSADYLKTRANLLTKEKMTAKIKKDGNPLITECYACDKSIYCRGNFTLTNLNISCNKLTARSLNEFIEVLKYQSEFTHDNKSFIHLTCDDCFTNKYPLEWLKISDLMKDNYVYNKHRLSERNRFGSTAGPMH